MSQTTSSRITNFPRVAVCRAYMPLSTPPTTTHFSPTASRAGGNSRWTSALPSSHPEQAPWEPSPPDSALAWKDRVALYAQFSPSATLSAILDALCAGAPHDAGIEALYAFANVDIWQVAHRFFGRKQDLGQFERFKRVIVAPPYDVLLRAESRETLSALALGPDRFAARVRFTTPRREPVVLTFQMTRTTLGRHTSWMVDSILREANTGEKPTARSPGA